MRNDRDARSSQTSDVGSADVEVRDRAWLAAAALGDRLAFEHLYLSHFARLNGFLARQTSHRELIEDIVSETFWVVWRKARDFRGESKVATWILGIAYRCMLKTLRTQPTQRRHSESIQDEDGDEYAIADSSQAEQRELRDWVRHGLALLPSEQRMTMELAYFFGQSCEEIASVMNCAVGTVKARMFHARVRLRNSLPTLAGDPASTRQ